MAEIKDHIQLTINDFQQKLAKQEEQVADTKRLINMLCKQAGRDPLYAETDATGHTLFNTTPDQYYGRPLATVMKEYLRMRKSANLGAATVNDIYSALVAGGYKFDAKNDQNAKRGLQISLSKNQDFHRIPSGAWGLTEWYPNVKSEKQPANGNSNDDDEAGPDESELKGGGAND